MAKQKIYTVWGSNPEKGDRFDKAEEWMAAVFESEEEANDFKDIESGYIGTYLIRGNEIKKILNKGLAECLLESLGPEDSCDFMMSELEGFELDAEGGTSWQ